MAYATLRVNNKQMADTEEKKKEEKAQATAVNVASLSVPTIIAALHQNALAHSDATSKGARLTNSAIEDDGGKAKITSAGEHIISVIPIDEKKPIDKKVAIEILKNYVQWFVGPDLASKVNSSTVKSLTEAPGNSSTGNEEKKGTDKFSTDEGLSESHHFMSFKQFLREADEDNEKDGFSSDSDLDDEESKAEDKKEDDKKDGFTGDDDLEDKNEDLNIGYYVPYSLKVEGLPQTALKDAMKKFASTFFDDVKITASGLFGGGDSFTVKDIKDTLRDAFGPIDPESLQQNVDKEITEIKHPDTIAEVKIRDKSTLIADLGSEITGPQKKMIDSADYSLWIKIAKDDPKKPIFNPRVVADIVTSSIKGLFKKFKNKITKNDVILIQNYHDTHENTEELNKLINSIPEPSKLTALISRSSNMPDAWKKVDDTFDNIRKNAQYGNSKFASAVVKLWSTFKEKHGEDKERIDASKGKDSKIREKYFKPFTDSYKKIFDENKPSKDELNESCIGTIVSHLLAKKFKLKFNIPANDVKSSIMSYLFESYEASPTLVDESSKVGDKIKEMGWTKAQALEHLTELKALSKKGEEKTKDQIDTYFEQVNMASTEDSTAEDSTEDSTEDSATKDSADSEQSSQDLENNGSQDNRADLYIIPLPSLKYKDKEYNTYA